MSSLNTPDLITRCQSHIIQASDHATQASAEWAEGDDNAQTWAETEAALAGAHAGAAQALLAYMRVVQQLPTR